jgi:hypothetical protein
MNLKRVIALLSSGLVVACSPNPRPTTATRSSAVDAILHPTYSRHYGPAGFTNQPSSPNCDLDYVPGDPQVSALHELKSRADYERVLSKTWVGTSVKFVIERKQSAPTTSFLNSTRFDWHWQYLATLPQYPLMNEEQYEQLISDRSVLAGTLFFHPCKELPELKETFPAFGTPGLAVFMMSSPASLDEIQFVYQTLKPLIPFAEDRLAFGLSMGSASDLAARGVPVVPYSSLQDDQSSSQIYNPATS